MHPNLRLPTSPVADPANVHAGADWRVTLLDAGLVRIEHSPSGVFEDRATQVVLHRDLPPVEHEVVAEEGRLEITTERLRLRWDCTAPWPGGLSVHARGGISPHASTWRPGAPTSNLGGTARTLDDVDGRVELEPGILSRDGVAVVDDATSLALGEDGLLHPHAHGSTDLYAFVFGRDYRAALEVWHRVTGPQPLLPRFALGNWWSRFNDYSAEEFLALFDRFADEGVPFSVAVIDMDWHLVDIAPELGSGWTGYTWNRQLFPDPEGFLEELHDRGLRTTLNVHPAEGVQRHEEQYAAAAERMGIDPSTGRAVAFDAADPAFLATYLEVLHHPLEEQGVDFWWIDWQQGTSTSTPGLDPLWVLNHVHWLDAGRDGTRPLIFSRYSGLGSHRYPIGFSGDTIASWDSLAFQPEFTATAANVGYGWWSHDVGGHILGVRDDELATRWVQHGVFSPITRLHTGSDPFTRREPWKHGPAARLVIDEFLRLRHRLVPYLATMVHRAHHEHRSLVAPMYHDHPWVQEAYEVPNQHTFGSELVVAPITTPLDVAAQVARADVWLPPGAWIDLLTGVTYSGDRALALHRPLEQIPVLARAGAIVPLTADQEVSNGVALPATLELVVAPGADGAFTLVEDDDADRVVTTAVAWDQEAATLRVEPPAGAVELLPARRAFVVRLVGFGAIKRVEVTVDGVARDVVPDRAEGRSGARLVEIGSVDRAAQILVRVVGEATPTTLDLDERVFELLDRAQIDRAVKQRAWALVEASPTPAAAAAQLGVLDLPPVLLGALLELLLA